jgi:hypothetical protein|tara:strand:+ start:180 stop:431 length:252 start_codon:yes stop_codon:yes gene_type:complete
LIEDTIEGSNGELFRILSYPFISLPLKMCVDITGSSESPYCLGAPLAVVIPLVLIFLGVIIGFLIGKRKENKQPQEAPQEQVQ